MVLITPPSARSAAPLVADDNGLHTKATSAATSSTRAKRLSNEEGRTLRKNSCSISARLIFRAAAICSTNVSTPSESVGPGKTVLTVTLVPAVVSAKPREIASYAVLVMP